MARPVSVAVRFNGRLSARVNNRGQQEYTGKSMQQADRVAGPIHSVANEFEPFQAKRLGLEHISIEKHHAILDVGCGGGRTVSKLATIATQGKVYGIDYSDESIAATNKRMLNG
jgi:ubiquinone/menaquinone biosynthesis C-methylase UbiE